MSLYLTRGKTEKSSQISWDRDLLFRHSQVFGVFGLLPCLLNLDMMSILGTFGCTSSPNVYRILTQTDSLTNWMLVCVYKKNKMRFQVPYQSTEVPGYDSILKIAFSRNGYQLTRIYLDEYILRALAIHKYTPFTYICTLHEYGNNSTHIHLPAACLSGLKHKMKPRSLRGILDKPF
jgi:hypothetical protein